MQDFRNLNVWEKSHRLVLEIYEYTKSFPREERYGLTGQVRRAATSIPANIAEGCMRDSDADFARFVQIALGSASELEYHVLLSKDLGYIADESYQTIGESIQTIKRMLSKLKHTLRINQKR